MKLSFKQLVIFLIFLALFLSVVGEAYQNHFNNTEAKVCTYHSQCHNVCGLGIPNGVYNSPINIPTLIDVFALLSVCNDVGRFVSCNENMCEYSMIAFEERREFLRDVESIDQCDEFRLKFGDYITPVCEMEITKKSGDDPFVLIKSIKSRNFEECKDFNNKEIQEYCTQQANEGLKRDLETAGITIED